MSIESIQTISFKTILTALYPSRICHALHLWVKSIPLQIKAENQKEVEVSSAHFSLFLSRRIASSFHYAVQLNKEHESGLLVSPVYCMRV
jgi:hypothetical protein